MIDEVMGERQAMLTDKHCFFEYNIAFHEAKCDIRYSPEHSSELLYLRVETFVKGIVS